MQLFKRSKLLQDTGRHYLSEYYFRIQVIELNENDNVFKNFFPFKEQLLIICLRGNGILVTEDNEAFSFEENDQIFVTKPFTIERKENIVFELIWSPGLHGASMDDWRNICPPSPFRIV